VLPGAGGYYVALGPAEVDQWIIYLQGGMWCWSIESCNARWAAAPFEMSSVNWTSTLSVGGIFAINTSNPFVNSNRAYLAYCSSDAWVGAAPASAATGGYAFMGQAILEAAINDMTTRLGLSSTSSVLFGGCSSGARGALFTLDYVASMLPSGASLRGMFDSPLWLDLVPPDTTETTLQEQTQGVFSLVNPGARIPAACAAAYPGAEGWRCLFGQCAFPSKL